MTFARLLRRYYFLRSILSKPREQRELWERVAFRLLLKRYEKMVVRHYGGYVPVAAEIGPGAVFQHEFHGVFIAGRAKIGANAHIVQNVTIGAGFGKNGRPTIDAPVIGNNVFIGAGAAIIGRCRIGDGARIGANVTLVNVDVPPGAVIVNKSAYDLTNKRFIYPQD